jgi:caffeoyl-CoA O-methyltransferase
MERKIEQYIVEHSSPEDPVLEDLYRQTHIRFVNPNMVSGHQQGKLLEMISRMISPKKVLEIGTFTGYSAICLAKGIAEGGMLTTIESNDELAAFSATYFEKAGVSHKIISLIGRAQDIIPGLNDQFDLVFIDGDKREYCEYFRLVKEKVNKEGYILADNVLWGGKAIDSVTNDPQTRGIIEFNKMIKNEPGIENLILPFRDGLMIIRKNAF